MHPHIKAALTGALVRLLVGAAVSLAIWYRSIPTWWAS